MFLQKFFCFELRTGIMRYGLANVILSSLLVGVHFLLSITTTDEEYKKAEVHTFLTGANVLNVCIKGSLSYGAYKEQRIFFLPYLLAEALVLLILTLLSIIYMFMDFELVLLLFICALFWYIWLCVLSYYHMLDPRYNQQMTVTVLSPEAVFVQPQSELHPPPAYYENKIVDV